MKRQVRIFIGEFYASREPAVINTVLGSCVAVCLFDPVKRIGGLNHILMPGKADIKHFDAQARYGINAMELLINKIMQLGGGRRCLTAKVFGGAHILPAISEENGIGRKNIRFALDFLGFEGIRILSRDVGGYDSRSVFFHTDTGEVLLKRIPAVQFKQIAVQEQRALRRIKKETKTPGKVDLF